MLTLFDIAVPTSKRTCFALADGRRLVDSAVVARGRNEPFIEIGMLEFVNLLNFFGEGIDLAEDLDQHAHVVAFAAVVPAHLLAHLAE